ncbi:MAG: hypothetical protein EHM67_02290 [Hyphomicrobiaceae bacterium]|nr:MAG: hypothetical protein EHM67_02290 [Hyphomicrobiaceae bacterium]
MSGRSPQAWVSACRSLRLLSNAGSRARRGALPQAAACSIAPAQTTSLVVSQRLHHQSLQCMRITQAKSCVIDEKLRLKHFTPAMAELFPLRDGDRGRPITDAA